MSTGAGRLSAGNAETKNTNFSNLTSTNVTNTYNANTADSNANIQINNEHNNEHNGDPSLLAQSNEMPDSELSSPSDEYEVNMEEKSSEEKSCTAKSLEEQKPPQQLLDIPDGGYGWFIVLACFLINFNSWGANSGFSIYLSYYLNNGTFKGGDKYDYAVIGGMTFGVGLSFSPAINYIQGKIGLRTTIIIGNCFQFAALMLASFSRKLWQLYLTQGMLQAFGLAFVSLPALMLLPQWFKKKRAFASAIAAAGSGCGGIVYNLGMQKVLESRSVFWAMRCQAIICFGLLWFSIFLVRTRMEVKYTIFDAAVLKTMGFWLFCLYVVLCMFGYVIVLYDMANVTTSMGYSAYQGSIASAMVQVGSVFGRPIVGHFCDRFGAVTVSVVAYLLCGILVLGMWIPANNYATIIAFCVIMGSLMGSIFATVPAILSLLFGLRRVGVALCMSWVFLGFAGLASPVIGLTLKTGNHGYVSAGQYHHSAIFCGVSFIACSFTLLMIRGYLVSRHLMSDGNDADHGHLHMSVPIWGPIKNCLRKARHI
ncbi:putative transporter protein [Clavispora lusitaniae]|uniref:Transporter protein n=1 Tax=Clavispora lusitaniae TaxID=36911 RepID=A0ACD0WPG2_CLALS|nr:putative transporter protein [Clavispora lusitaniae]QFZ35126.1 putative transporter protein [Clavispora lusitaniae]QFZ40811.1 putative transporter protein [Clavispora lusitaniae]QFZ46491.1 putative transporter protein [Clavispora lusitaniae]QFZ52153.1 putative transporter protein [Clavispora lusitaniae]